jgi:cytochrome c-type biogenesis protein CcmH/NrfG
MRNKTAEKKIQKLLDKLVQSPDDTETRLALGKQYFLGSRFDEAVSSYRTLLEQDPRNVSAHYNLAVALVALKKMEEAKVAFQKVLEIDPNNRAAQEELAKLVSFP